MANSFDPDEVSSAAAAASATAEDLKQAKSTLIQASFDLTADLTTVGAQKAKLSLEKIRLQRDLQNGEASAFSTTEPTLSVAQALGDTGNRIREIDKQLTSLDVKEKSTRDTLNQTLTRTADIEKQLQLQEVAPGRVVSAPENSEAANLSSTAPQGQQPVSAAEQITAPAAPEVSGNGISSPVGIGESENLSGLITPTESDTNPREAPPNVTSADAFGGSADLVDLPGTTKPVLASSTSLEAGSDPTIRSTGIGAEDDIEQQQFGAGINFQTTAAPNQGAYGSTTQVRVENRDELLDTANQDWRFKISLAPGAQYFYNVAKADDILRPLKDTNGVIFPYTPQINVTYGAAYEPVDLTHANYRSYNYKNSYVDAVTITGDFTAQDTYEANYVLAVIHFFRSVTKMWYGKDETPIRGTPPPLCYLSGHGAYAFDLHPVVITSFTLNYPTDVDYINASQKPIKRSGELIEYNKPTVGRQISPLQRLKNAGLAFGGKADKKANVQNELSSQSYSNVDNNQVTRIPTKLQITLTAQPIVTRNTISNNFSLNDYATGKLLRGRLLYSKNGGGIW